MRYSLTTQPRWNYYPLRNFTSLLDQFLSDEVEQTPSLNAQPPRAEVVENEKAYVLSLDVPGIKEEDIKIELQDQTLKISGERKSQVENSENGFRRSEKFYGQFERIFTLPQNADVNAIDASATDGVLQVTIPKSAEAVARKIEVKKASDRVQ